MSTALEEYGASTSNTITVSDVTVDGQVQDGATVEATVVDVATNTPVAGVTWPVTLASAGAGTGDYVATLDAAAGFVAGRRYRTTITITVNGLTLTLTREGIGVAL